MTSFHKHLVVAAISWGNLTAQPLPSPDALVRELSVKARDSDWRGGCGVSAAKRRAAQQLWTQGAAAVPALEAALEDSLERSNEAPADSDGFAWFAQMYAQLKGRDALPRLRRFGSITWYQTHYGDAIRSALAMSMDVTEYLTDYGTIQLKPLCRREEPRDAVNRLAQAWLRGGDQKDLEGALGANAKASLRKSMGAPRYWLDFRNEIGGKQMREYEFGYRLMTGDGWELPESLVNDSTRNLDSLPEGPAVTRRVTFVSRTGAWCETLPITLAQTFRGTGPIARRHFLRDDPRVVDILRVISQCASLP